MTAELQGLVESLGRRLGRSVAIDDAKVRLLAYSSHQTEVDEARVASIMTRTVPTEVAEWIFKHGAKDAQGLFVVPPKPDIGLTVGRIGIPVRHQQQLLAFLWLLDTEGDVTGDDEAVLVKAVATAASMIFGHEMSVGRAAARERELVEQLLAESNEDSRLAAADELVGARMFVDGVPIVSLCVVPETSSYASLDIALQQARAALPIRYSLHTAHPEFGLLIVGDDTTAVSRTADIARNLRTAVQRNVESGDCFVGIGSFVAHLHDAGTSSRQARFAAEVARTVKDLGRVVSYQDLGIYRLLGELSNRSVVDVIPAGLQTLFDEDTDRDGRLVRTLEAFLDNAGDAKRAADSVFIHRGTLYYRLRQIQEITGMDLSNGEDRLLLHLGLRALKFLDGSDVRRV